MSTNKAVTEWTEIRQRIKTKWGKLVDSEVDSFKGNMDLISEKIQKTYGFTKDKAEQEYKDFKKTLEASPEAPVKSN